MKSVFLRCIFMGVVVVLASWGQPGVVGAAGPAAGRAQSAPADTSLVIPGDQDGTTFGNLTVEGENRVRIQFDRPELEIELDPRQAPGLDLGSAMDVLNRTVPDLVSPFMISSADRYCPHLARPWLQGFATAPVARFRPEVEGVERWQLTVANSRSQTVAMFEGDKKPPPEIAWDGFSLEDEPASPGLTYSYIFEAFDRAGNKRSFAGQSFQLSAYRLDGTGGPIMLIPGAELRERGDSRSAAGLVSHHLIQEAASWLNLTMEAGTPLQVVVTARSFGEADALGQEVVAALKPLLAGNPARISVITKVRADAAEMGVLSISPVE